MQVGQVYDGKIAAPKGPARGRASTNVTIRSPTGISRLLALAEESQQVMLDILEKSYSQSANFSFTVITGATSNSLLSMETRRCSWEAEKFCYCRKLDGKKAVWSKWCMLGAADVF